MSNPYNWFWVLVILVVVVLLDSCHQHVRREDERAALFAQCIKDKHPAYACSFIANMAVQNRRMWK